MPKHQKNIPALRFSEFTDDWEKTPLGEIGEVIRGASPRPKGDKRYYGGNIPRLMVEDVTRDGKYVTPRTDYLTEEGAKLSRPCKKGTLTVVCSGTVGIPAILAVDACIHDGFLAFRDIKKNYNVEFVYTYLSRLQSRFDASATHGGVFVNLTTTILKEFIASFPSLTEQQKIADFFGAIDKKIVFLQKKKDQLENYKRGCMQKLFSQEIRFTDDSGKSFPLWEEKKLSAVYDWLSTNSLSREKLTYETDVVQNIHYGDIHTRFHKKFRQSKEIIPFIIGAKKKDFNNESFLSLGDVVIADASEDYADIGKAIEVIELNDTPLVAGLHTYIARPKPETLALGFSCYLFQSPEVRKQIMKIAQGISVLGVSKGNLEKIELLLPHPDEQKKIADFLSVIDDKIALVSEELEKTMLFKKGLLQKMFV